MRLTVQNVMGAEHVELELVQGQAVEVVGPNASGKTSVAVAAQAVLARTPNPLGLAGPEAKRAYQHDAGGDSWAALDVDGATVTWQVRAGRIVAPTDDSALSRAEAVGMVDFTARRGAKEQAALLQPLLLPPPAEVEQAVAERLERYMPAQDLMGVMKMLRERGWDATEAVFAERAREAKRQWSALTNRTYGVRVAGDWRPTAWHADFDRLTVQQAESAVVEARDLLSRLHKVQAVTQAEAEAAAEAAGQLPTADTDLRELERTLSTMRGDRAGIPVSTSRDSAREAEAIWWADQRHLRALQDVVGVDTSVSCPHCGNPVVVTAAGDLAVYDTVGADLRRAELRGQIETIGSVMTEHAGDYQQAVERHTADSEKAAKLDEDLHAMEQARARLMAERDHLAETAAKRGEVETAEDRATLAEAQQAVEDAQKVVGLVAVASQAGRLHETVVRYTEAAQAVGPQGVRATMLATGLGRLNAGLNVLSDTAEWPAFNVDRAGALWLMARRPGQDAEKVRPVALCSESERWRAQASMQLTLAALSGSRVVVLDRADLLDPRNRDGLVRAVERVAGKTGLAVLLCSTSTGGGGPWARVRVANGVTA